MIFIDNKYNRLYYNIINQAKTRQNTGYVEIHHIIPKSIGGTNDKENLVELTAKEHFICHRLLPKMTTGDNKRKMTFAAWALTSMRNPHLEKIKISSRTYSYIKQERSSALKGVPLPEEVREKMRIARAKQVITEETKEKIKKTNTGKKQSEETKRKRAESLRGKKRTEEQKQRQKESALNCWANKDPITEESRRNKIREARAKQVIITKQVTCPHCGKTGGDRIMPRYHFDNCKTIPR